MTTSFAPAHRVRELRAMHVPNERDALLEKHLTRLFMAVKEGNITPVPSRYAMTGSFPRNTRCKRSGKSLSTSCAGLAECLWRPKDDDRAARPAHHHCDIVETGNESWRFETRA